MKVRPARVASVISPLLETKLYVPRLRHEPVPRPRLSDRLGHAREWKLALISAPAGFGKTTLVSAWLAARPGDKGAAAWLSLDPDDNEPTRFWTYLISAIRTIASEVGTSSLSILEERQQAPIETALAMLLNELQAMDCNVVLVLDDYHVIENAEVHRGLTFMLEHLPATVSLVMTTREDPPLPLSRMRARGELLELRAADLRFTPEEAAAYLNEVMRLDLPAGDVVALEGRTEGWIAALQLAALSVQGRADPSGFIAGFAGDDRYIVDYLAEEVLERQAEAVRNFLLQTSILTRLTGSLCDVVTGQSGSGAMLEELDRRNLFLVPLDERRQWYRFHHLFGDVLRARLLDEQAELVKELHQRATEWYEQNGERPEAIRHALEGDNASRAADLIELAIPGTYQARQEATLRRWLEALPDDVVGARPVLSDAYAGSLLSFGKTEGVERRIRDAERWLGLAVGPDGAREVQESMVVVDQEAFRDLPTEIAIHRAGLARLLGDVTGTIAHAQRALEVAREDDDYRRGAAAALLGLAHWTNADLDAAYQQYEEASERFARSGHLPDVVGCAIHLADIRITQARLQEAVQIYQHGLNLATRGGGPALRGAADMHVGLSDICRERNELVAALDHVHAAQELGEENGLPQNPYRSRVVEARIRQVQGDMSGALDLLAEADRLYNTDFAPSVRPVSAWQARAIIGQGRLSEAWAWARRVGISASDELTYEREFEHITLARLLIASGGKDQAEEQIVEALGLLERLLNAADQGGRTGSVIEILMLQALAHHVAGNSSAGLPAIERAIRLAGLEGYIRTFLDEGPPMTALLKLAARQRAAPAHVRRLLTEAGTGPSSTDAHQALIEPLSERELEVLRLLGSELDGPEIARELVVSLNTLRTHTRNVYAKLGVNNRRAAVSRASDLGLLSRSGDPRAATP